MSLRSELAYLRQAALARRIKPADPLDSMSLAELDAEIARLDAELAANGMTPEEIGVDTHLSSVGYWLERGYSPENAEALSKTL